MTLIVGAYIVTFGWRLASLERYSEGFVIDKCPVCEVGNLALEEKVYRVLAIPRVRRTVRCDNCRSVLREVGGRRWRYAVDGNQNPQIYEEFNNKMLQEEQLMSLGSASDPDAPSYIE